MLARTERDILELEVFVESSKIEHGDHSASSVWNLLGPKFVGRVLEFERRGEAIQAGENAAV